MIKYIIYYLITINCIGFLIMGWDKHQAKKGGWRTPENTLFMIAVFGGSIGTIIGMYTFRHKTQKLRFTIGFPIILIVELFLVIYTIIKFH